MQLPAGDQAILDGRHGTAAAMAIRIVLGTARMLGASDLVSIASAHIDGCLYHGDSGRAPRTGLHLPENRLATLLIDARACPPRCATAMSSTQSSSPGSDGSAVAAIGRLPRVTEDRLKALGAAAASTGAVGLFHVIGTTPEVPDAAAAFAGAPPHETIMLTPAMIDETRRCLSTVTLKVGDALDPVAVGGPHLSTAELRALRTRLAGRRCAIPL